MQNIKVIDIDDDRNNPTTKKMKTKAQSIIEYSLLIAVVAAAFIAMHTYLQRSVQTNLKRIDNQLSPLPK